MLHLFLSAERTRLSFAALAGSFCFFISAWCKNIIIQLLFTVFLYNSEAHEKANDIFYIEINNIYVHSYVSHMGNENINIVFLF